MNLNSEHLIQKPQVKVVYTKMWVTLIISLPNELAPGNSVFFFWQELLDQIHIMNHANNHMDSKHFSVKRLELGVKGRDIKKYCDHSHGP